MYGLRWAVVCTLVLSSGAMTGGACGQEPSPVDLGPEVRADLKGCFPNLTPGEMDADGIPFQVTDGRLRVEPNKQARVDLGGAKCGSIHFLHYTEHSGDKLGAYVLEYGDGERVEVDLFSGLNIQDWWMPGPLAFAGQSYTDSFPRGDERQPIGFWRLSVPNPRPDVPLAAVEVRNVQHQAVINVVAITLAGPCGGKVGDVPVWRPGMSEEERLRAMLAVPLTVANKAHILEQTRAVATVKEIPMLAESLIDENLSHSARIVLEAMPYPEALNALREALGSTSGEAQMGIAESLGRRRDAESAPLIAPLLKDEDPVMASAAALALGRIGGPAATKHLKKALDAGATGAFRAAVFEGLLHCAESLSEKDEKAAHALYAELVPVASEQHQVTATFRGMILTGRRNAADIAVSTLMNGGPMQWAAALPAVREIEGDKATRAFSAAVARVPRDVLIGLLEGLGQRGDSAAAPAVAAMLEDDDAEVRSAAITALSLIGDGSSVPALARIAAQGSKAERAQAAQALAQINAPDVPAALQKLAEGGEPAMLVAAANAMGERGEPVAAPTLRKLTRHADGAVRGSAARALAQVGEASDAGLFCELAASARDEGERAEAERALIALGRKTGAPKPFVEVVLSALEAGKPEVRCALLRACGEFDNPRMIEALGDGLDDADATVREAAVRALADSEAAGALAHLLAVAENAQGLTHRVLALRGIARLASGADLEDALRADTLERAIAAAERPDEKKLLLGALGGCHTAKALTCAEEHLSDGGVAAEAAVAWAHIAAHVDVKRAEALAVLEKAKQENVPQEVQQAVMEIVRKATATPIAGEKVGFERIDIDAQFRSEGVAVADVNRDGQNDILVGDVCYLAPDWQVREIRPPQTYSAQEGYSQCFANFVKDVDQDGWMDSLVIGFPAAPAYWYRNPGEGEGHWEQRPLAASACGETPIFGDLLGNGLPVPVFAINKRIAWFRPRGDKSAEWDVHPVTQELPQFETFGHGLGMGDVNQDGRVDLMSTVGWWEAPEDRGRRDWTFHKMDLGPDCANMVVYDVDADGDNDIVTSSAHQYGIWWFEQKVGNGTVSFERHEIDKGTSQTHALILADINSDGVMDLVTGKRYRAHNGHDPGSAEPAALFWLELQRPAPGEVRFVRREIDNDSGVGTQFQVCDLDGDGLLDVVTSNKKGVHAFVQRRSN